MDNAVANLELRYDRIPGAEVVAMENFTTVIPGITCRLQHCKISSQVLPMPRKGLTSEHCLV